MPEVVGGLAGSEPLEKHRIDLHGFRIERQAVPSLYQWQGSNGGQHPPQFGKGLPQAVARLLVAPVAPL